MVGKREALTLVLAGILAKGHVLLEDYPGLGKTLAARSFAGALGLDFARAQFTPDLLPADLTGSYVYDQRRAEFDFRPGPVFAGLLLADEINRTPPKTQAALLEAMQEGQVTVEGQTHRLPSPFHVLATANPVEYEGTYPLPEAQLDRFLLRVGFGYPSAGEEHDVLRAPPRPPARGGRRTPGHRRGRARRGAGRGRAGGRSTSRSCATASTSWPRPAHHPDVLTGASPRGSLGLVLTARAWAAIRGRDFVVPEDVKVGGPRGAGAPGHRQARPLDDAGVRRPRRRLGPAARSRPRDRWRPHR